MPDTLDIIKANVLTVLRNGGSLRDAADYARITRGKLAIVRKEDPDFAKALREAIAQTKLIQLNKIAKADKWQAAAFFVERRWPDQFASARRTTRPRNVKKIVRFQPIPTQPKENPTNTRSPQGE